MSLSGTWVGRSFGLLALATLALSFSSCGASGAHQRYKPSDHLGGRRPSATARDRDNDGDHNDDDAGTLGYGHAANPADRQTSIALVTRYFAAAAKENGATACALLVPFIAESVVENDGHSPGLHGTTCATVLSKLFARHHRLLSKKHSTLKIVTIRVEGRKALAILDFSAIHEVREITERRTSGTWRILEPLDTIIE